MFLKKLKKKLLKNNNIKHLLYLKINFKLMKIQKIKLLYNIFFLLIVINFSNAQIKVNDSIKPKTLVGRQKIDGIIATVGDYIVLDSDIDKSFIEISTAGNSTKDITRCQMLGKLLEDKLYAHQAIQDS